MAINYTTLLGLAQPVTGTEASTWGDVVNDELTALVDSAIAGAATFSVTSGNVTLTSVDGAADQARMAILIATGTPGTTRNIVAPSQSKTYIVVNQSDASVVLKGSATTGVTIRAGQAATCVWNGADFESVASGDVDGPSTATNTAVAIFDGTTGKLLKNTGVTIDGSNNVSGVVQLNATTLDATNIEVTNLKAKDGTAAGSIADSTGVVTLASSVLTTTDINGGTIDGTTIGGSTAAAGTFTSLTDSGNLTFTGTGNRILGDFTNATFANRVAFQTSTVNSNTNIFAIPNGTAAASGWNALNNADPTNASYIRILANSSSYTSLESGIFGTGTYLPMTFFTGGSERVRVDTSGNVGIGVTPSAWGSYRGLQVGNASVADTIGGNNALFGSNVFFDGSNFKYISTTTSTLYRQVGGEHRWENAPSGTAGNAISFTQAMTLDASGDLGIGTASPAKRFHVKGTNDDVAIFDNDGSRYTTCYFANNGTSKAVIDWDNTASYFEIAALGANPIVFGTNGSERMRIDSSGNVGIGTSSPSTKLDVVGSVKGSALQASGTPTGGFSANSWFIQNEGSSITRAYCSGDNTSTFGILEEYSAYSNGTPNITSSVSASRQIFYTDNAERMRITSGGEVYIAGTTDQGAYNLQCNGTGVWGAGAYVNGSDRNLKDNITPLGSCLDVVAALKPVTYQYKEEYSKDQSVQPGFIAQDLQDAMAGKEYLEGIVQAGPNHLNVAYQNLIPILTKALQEQQALIQDLTTRLTALEGN